MKPLDESGRLQRGCLKSARALHLRKGISFPLILLSLFCVDVVMLPGCGTAGLSSTTPSNVAVSVQPGSASLFLGQTQQFQATVTGATD
jgi:hypothetical protein